MKIRLGDKVRTKFGSGIWKGGVWGTVTRIFRTQQRGYFTQKYGFQKFHPTKYPYYKTCYEVEFDQNSIGFFFAEEIEKLERYRISK